MSDRAQEAADFIISHCTNVGAFYGTGDPYAFLQDTAKHMRAAKPSPVFPDRYIEHVAYAVNAVGLNMFLSPAAAVSSVYLATRFEFYFRVLSGVLNADGTWISPISQRTSLIALSDKRLEKPRISSVALAYELMKLGTSKVVPYCAALDRALYASAIQVNGNFKVAHVGDRIEFGRHSAGHGQWGDISAEAVFYGLMTAVIFYAHS